MKVSDLKPNPGNPRTISDSQLSMLKKSVEKYGDLSGIVFNRTSQQLIGGHQRTKILPEDAKIVIERNCSKSKTGTVAEGYTELAVSASATARLNGTNPLRLPRTSLPINKAVRGIWRSSRAG